MCGRFTLSATVDDLMAAFPMIRFANIETSPRGNICPTQQVLAVRRTETDAISACWFRWGLVPFWAKDLKIGASMINARAETIIEKPAFRTAFKKRRCLVLADGFIEWTGEKKARKPWNIAFADRRPMTFAGLWERWGEAENVVETCTIVTTTANDAMSKLHDRMPVILTERDHERWLDCSPCEPALLTEMLQPYSGSDLALSPIETALPKA
ncbi:MAG: SOS response-associated peptidase [Gemmataceae bacterium]|nr:SOS response-associated peptidase [Gemmataceae bacterium]